ncbi:thiamin biosynthesis ThiGH complex subunit [Frankia canadensis]|uniref:Thiamin biosynthesis ThiGH complex subunit n=1 Tax=Frankia canadensis TaxID=1836972 RepID=A0A2I2KRN0_9ACTN|nr:2-iminoacetate synthase ThiH [Frankia canadensis]SNQ48324.1 thiamin biosynthesis ThiGH complex subunit [Frankia canadensis]SOU55614.1 thiamin biosynthesis ThiGH complex subunit [Frankia canadensis]
MSAPPGLFARELAGVDLPALSARSRDATPAQVDALLRRIAPGGAGRPAPARAQLGLAELAVLLSPAAGERLEELALAARETTLRRFGRAVRLFAPLYVSNECLSSCTYCGFARGLPVARRTLDVDEVEAEGRLLAARGFRHLLLVAGEHRVEVSADYLVAVVERLRPLFPSLSIETQTWSDDTYARLVRAGLEGVVHYQETYDRARYAQVHVAGWKRDYDRRLSSFERAAAAGARRLGIGALLGLAPDWRADVLALGAHAAFLTRRYWRTEVSVALPRIKPSASDFPPVVVVSDAEFTQAHAALRLFGPDLALSLSTREPAPIRDGLVRIAVTTMSAGSSTEPGGYSTPGTAQEQFSISDERPPAEVAAMLVEAGYEPVWKDAFPLVDASPAG